MQQVNIKANYIRKIAKKALEIVKSLVRSLSLLLASEYIFIFLQRYEEAKIKEGKKIVSLRLA
jgi:hypothetical protein